MSLILELSQSNETDVHLLKFEQRKTNNIKFWTDSDNFEKLKVYGEKNTQRKTEKWE